MKSVVVVLAMSAGAFAQPESSNTGPTATFRSAVSNVKIDVQVTNKTDLVRDLTLTDFALFDQDRQRELLYVDRGSEPLSLVLLLDVSGSMRKHVEAVAGVALSSLRFFNRRIPYP